MEDAPKKLGLAPGDVLVSSWGYDQTNVDFYKVVVGAEPGKFCQLVKVAQKAVSGGGDGYGQAGRVIADPDSPIGQVFKKKVKDGGLVKIASYAHAYLWDGSPKYWSDGH